MKKPPVPQKPISFDGTLLESRAPTGFDENGLRVVVEFPEFRMVEQWAPEPYENKIIVELSPQLEAVRWRALFRTIDKTCKKGKRKTGEATTPEERIAWANALVRLADYTASGGTAFDAPALGQAEAIPFSVAMHATGGHPAAARLAHTIGRRLTSLHDGRDVEEAIQDAAAVFKNAMRAYAAASGLLRDRRAKWIIPREVVLIDSAVGSFTYTRKRPDKKTLRQKMEALGMKFGGQNQAVKWSDFFNKAGLGNLPDSPPS